MKRLLFISWIFLLSVSFGLTKMKADVRMPLIFGDHMVLQQDTKIAIFGWADLLFFPIVFLFPTVNQPLIRKKSMTCYKA